MRIETRKIYTAAELGKECPEAFDRALEKYREEAGAENPPWSDDICESGRATVEVTGLTLRDWSVDQSNISASYYKVEGFGQDSAGEEIADYTGRKAREWITKAFLPKYKFNWRIKRNPGDCPFTGYCADDDCIDAIRDAIKGGETLKEAFEGLAAVVAKICASESEYVQTEAYFLDHASANGWEYTEDGERV
jgi:hypothetical protein